MFTPDEPDEGLDLRTFKFATTGVGSVTPPSDVPAPVQPDAVPPTPSIPE